MSWDCCLSPEQRARCIRDKPVLQEFMDGVLDAADTQLVADRLRDCRGCGLELTAYRALRSALRDHLTPPEPSLDRLRRFVAALEAEETAEAHHRGRSDR